MPTAWREDDPCHAIDKDKAADVISFGMAGPVSTGRRLCQEPPLSSLCLLLIPSALTLPFSCPLHVCSAFHQAMHAALQVLTAATGQQKGLSSPPCSTL